MKLTRTLTLSIFALSAALTTATAQSNNPQDPALMRLGNGIAAIAEGHIITIEELRQELNPIIPRLRVEARNQEEFAKRIDEISKEVLQNMIDRIIIVKEADEKGLLIPQSYIDQEYDEVIARDFGGDRARFLTYLSERGITARDYRNDVRKNVIVNVMRQQTRKSQSEISPERIEDFYVKNKLRFYQSESMHLRQIILTPMADEGLVPLRQTAKQVSDELKNGANFGDLARKYSQDDMSRRGGDWGWIERQDIRKELSEVAFGLQAGQYSEPIELSGTIFILYAEAKREEMIQPISQVRDIIENVLVGELARETQEKWLQDIRNKSYIRYYM
ncbi:MAG: peptidylprolyl isomerase [Opitutaceae bacterium]